MFCMTPCLRLGFRRTVVDLKACLRITKTIARLAAVTLACRLDYLNQLLVTLLAFLAPLMISVPLYIR